MNENKWYQKSIFIVLLLIAFLPVGLYFMWKYTAWSKKIKWLISVPFAIFWLFTTIALLSNDPKSTQTPPVIVPQTNEQQAPVIEQQKTGEQRIDDGTVLVTRVIDGDTIEIEGGQKIRYIGIDTPETVDPRKPVQCFGVEANNRNKDLVGGKRVLLEKDVSELDKYGRLLRYVYVDGIFVNLVLVQEGFAYSYTYPPDVKYQNQFVEAERLAREQKKGLWDSCPTTDTQPEPATTPTPTQTSPTPASTPSPAPAPTPAPTPTQTSSCNIKGNISSGGKIYHVLGCSSYDKTEIKEVQGERWFCTEEEAVAAGWRKALNCP